MPFVSVNNKKIYYTVASPSSGTASSFTLLCIHGLGSTNSFYAPLTPHFNSLGFTILAIDSHGAGLSTYTGNGNSITSIADDAWDVLESLGEQVPRNVVLLGHSMGGIVASEIALKHEKRVKGVVLIGPVNPNPGAAEAFGRRIALVQEGGMEPLALTVPTAATGSRSSPLVHAFIRALLLANEPEAYISMCCAIAEARVPDYEAIKAPLLIIAGSEDKSAPIEGSSYIRDMHGSANKEQKILEGVGHWHNLEAPEEVSKLVGDFVLSL